MLISSDNTQCRTIETHQSIMYPSQNCWIGAYLRNYLKKIYKLSFHAKYQLRKIPIFLFDGDLRFPGVLNAKVNHRFKKKKQS